MAENLSEEWQELHEAERAAYDHYVEAQALVIKFLSESGVVPEENLTAAEKAHAEWRQAGKDMDEFIERHVPKRGS